MDTNDYRRKIEQSVAKAQARDLRGQRRAAAQRISHALVANKKTPPKTRAEALGRVTRAEGPDAVPQAALERLADPQGITSRATGRDQAAAAATDSSARWRPSGVPTSSTRCAPQSAIASVRPRRFEVLSLFKDRPTQELLLEGIRKPERGARARCTEALRLLSTDVHADVDRRCQRADEHAQIAQEQGRVRAGRPHPRRRPVVGWHAQGSAGQRRLSDGAPAEWPPRRSAICRPTLLRQAQRAPRSGRARTTAKSKPAAKTAAKPKGDLAKHLETLQRIRG